MTLEDEADLDTPYELLSKFHRLLPKVDVKHFEVVLRAMLESQAGKQRITGLSKAIRKRGWLTQLGFDEPRSVLQESALRKERDNLAGILDNIMIGKYQG